MALLVSAKTGVRNILIFGTRSASRARPDWNRSSEASSPTRLLKPIPL
jgi:hypothetical protein